MVSPDILPCLDGGAEPFDPLGLPYAALAARVTALGGSPLHARRWFRAIHQQGEVDPFRAFELGRGLCNRLRAAIRPSAATVESRHAAGDGTLKLRLRLAEGARVEAVIIPEGERRTLCLSSQAGCAVGCRFCSTGAMGLVRNLTAGEIVAQLAAARAAAPGRITNLVFMGMGEPLHNWPAVRDAVEILSDSSAHAFSRKRLTLSTAGVLPRMEAVARARIPLALSLHATREEEREALIPLNRRYPIAALVAELKRLTREHKAIVMIQYLLLAGRNDSPRHARELGALLGGFPCHVNLLGFNPVPGTPYRPSPPETALWFRDALRGQGLRVTLRASRGRAIAGACGQLALAGSVAGH